MYIFWDNSNIQYAGLNSVLPVKEPDVDRGRYRTYFKGLLNLVSRGRIIDKVYLAGSIPPGDDALWDTVERLGIETTLIPRSESSGEADTTDFALQTDLLRLGYDVQEPGTIALLTGDGAGINSGKGFLADAKRLTERGWKFEVYSWDAACNSKLREFAMANGKYFKLEDYYEYITFIVGGRRPVELQSKQKYIARIPLAQIT